MPIDVKKTVEEVQLKLAEAVESSRLDGGALAAQLMAALPAREAVVRFLVSQGCDRAWAEEHVIEARYDDDGNLCYTLKMPPITQWFGTFELTLLGNA